MNVSSFLLAILIVVTVFFFLSKGEIAKQKELKRKRANYNSEHFSEYFYSDNIPKDFSKIIYKYLQSLLAVNDFPILPRDDLSEIFGIGQFGGVGLDEVIEDITTQLGCDSSANIEGSFGKFDNKVEDLVKYMFFICQKGNKNVRENQEQV